MTCLFRAMGADTDRNSHMMTVLAMGFCGESLILARQLVFIENGKFNSYLFTIHGSTTMEV